MKRYSSRVVMRLQVFTCITPGISAVDPSLFSFNLPLNYILLLLEVLVINNQISYLKAIFKFVPFSN